MWWENSVRNLVVLPKKCVVGSAVGVCGEGSVWVLLGGVPREFLRAYMRADCCYGDKTARGAGSEVHASAERSKMKDRMEIQDVKCKNMS